MAGRFSPDTVLNDAARIDSVWTENPSLTLGEVTHADFKGVMSEVATLDKTVEDKRIELEGLMKRRDEKSRTLSVLNTRAKSVIRGVFGPDTAQYKQAGGTPTSERKAPKARKPRPKSDLPQPDEQTGLDQP